MYTAQTIGMQTSNWVYGWFPYLGFLDVLVHRRLQNPTSPLPWYLSDGFTLVHLWEDK